MNDDTYEKARDPLKRYIARLRRELLSFCISELL